MRKVIILLMFVCSLCGYTQIVDTRPVVGVAKFTCEVDPIYAGLVTEKVVEMLTNTKRFRVVDRTSFDKIAAELDLQKDEAFMDSESTVEQDVAIGAEKMIIGHIVKIPVYAMTNSNGSVKGYKASVAFQMKVVDVATGVSTEATSFQGKASDLMLSPESAVTFAMASLQLELEQYFKKNFPIIGKISMIVSSKNGRAEAVLLNVGKEHGIAIGDKLTVEYVEMLEGIPCPTEIGIVEVVKLKGDTFSECKVPKKSGEAILSHFNNASVIKCNLIIK